LSARPALLCS